jgi:hypothetical protein
MADFSDEFKTHLKTVSGVTALVGSGINARVYSDVLKEGCQLPAIVYYERSGKSYEYLGGIAGLVRVVMHVIAYGVTRAQANNLAEVIRTKALNTSYNGTFGSTAVATISSSQHRRYGFDTTTDGAYRYWCERIYDIHHAEDTS